MKPRLLNILFFWVVKYIAFFIFMMFKNDNFTFIKVNEIKNGEDLFYYLWIFLFLPVVCMIILSAPLHFLFKTSKINYFLLIICIILIAEYFIYTYLASQADLMNGVYNGIISILFLLLFYYKYLKIFFNQTI